MMFPAMERPLDMDEAQSYEQSMLEEFAKKHAEEEAAKTSTAA